MILLVPTSPEVPKYHRPTWGTSWIVAILLTVSYFLLQPTIEADQDYIDNFQSLKEEGLFTDEATERAFLAKRPLLSVSISPKSWDFERAIFSNFIHGSWFHLILNLIGVVAGVRICTTFIPFLCSFSIFILGGTAGLLFSSLAIAHPQGDFVPHLGASAGVFALMGTYYVYNFRFRTTYFFWFPSKHGRISLRTSWFFFLDAVLLELVLSAGQLLPQSVDGVDHLAHIGGFFAGCVLALLLRTLQRWPSVLQTRGEFLYWTTFLNTKLKEAGYDPVQASYLGWMELLKINFFNDQLKIRLVKHLTRHASSFSDEQIKIAFRFFGPTFVRLRSADLAALVRAIIKSQRTIPSEWLARTPYDIIIRLSHSLTVPVEEQYILLEFILAYRKAQTANKKLDKKLGGLIEKIQSLMPGQARASGD